MIVRISTGLSETCGYCHGRIPKDALVILLTSAMKKRCSSCVGLTPEQVEAHYNQIVLDGEREHDCAPKKSFSFRKAAIMAMDTLPLAVRERHIRALMERE